MSALLGINLATADALRLAVPSLCEGALAHVLPRFGNGEARPTLHKSLSGMLGADFSQLVDGASAHGTLREALTSWGCEGTTSFTVVPVSAAARAVRRATTMEEFGAALTQLRTEAGLSLKVLAERFKAARLWGLSKTTLSRSCNGLTLFQTEEQVVAFVTECDATDATEWVAAWERALADRRAREHQPPGTHAGPDDDVPSPAMPVLEQGCPDDEVLGEFHLRFTRGHLRTAIVLGAIAGVAATGASTPGVRNAGVVVLGLAAGLALLEQFRAAAAPTSTTLPGAA